MINYTTPFIKQIFQLIDAIRFMQRLHKHKGPLFVYKKTPPLDFPMNSSVMQQNTDKRDFYTVKPTFETALDAPIIDTCNDTFVARYHPYLYLLNRRPQLSFLNKKQFITSVPAGYRCIEEAIIYEWLRAYMKYPPFAAEVRAFEHSILKQKKEVSAYFRQFFAENILFDWHSIFIGFEGAKITSEEMLENKLLEITIYRKKLLSQLKNHSLITEKQTRYTWKIIVINNQLYMHLLILHKHAVQTDTDSNGYLEQKRQQLLEQVKQSAETVKIVINPEPSIISFWSKDTKETKRVHFNQQLMEYFNLDFWFPYYQIACKHPKKMLFGKGNDKSEKAIIPVGDYNVKDSIKRTYKNIEKIAEDLLNNNDW